MTNEELKNMPTIIDTLLDEAITDSARQKVKDKLTEVCQLAIQALEAQPCEDCISRQKMLDGLASIAKAKAKSDAQKALMGRVMFFTEQLPSVTPQRPKGEWIEIEIDAGEFIYKCTKCGMRVINPYKYCPICGAEMGGEEDG